MKLSSRLILSAALLVPAAAMAGEAPAPTTFAEAKNVAAEHDALLLLDFYTEW
jgi:hypothetical protein